jgi:hypothetical protein
VVLGCCCIDISLLTMDQTLEFKSNDMNARLWTSSTECHCTNNKTRNKLLRWALLLTYLLHSTHVCSGTVSCIRKWEVVSCSVHMTYVFQIWRDKLPWFVPTKLYFFFSLLVTKCVCGQITAILWFQKPPPPQTSSISRP